MNAPSGQAEVLVVLWDRQSVWSQTAHRLKNVVTRARLATLVLTVTGAVFGAVSAQVMERAPGLGRAFAVVAAVALTLASLTGRAASRPAIQNWTRARSVSEALKTEVYTYLAGVTPFRDADRTEVLLRRFDGLAESASDLVNHTATVSPRPRPVPDVVGVASYAEVRVRGQISGYYRPRAKLMALRARRLRWTQVALTAASALLAAIVGISGSATLTSWIGVLTTVSAAVAAHIGASRYEYQQIEFARTADELERLLARRAARSPDPAQDDVFVADCERIISIQNEGWMAKLAAPADKRNGTT